MVEKTGNIFVAAGVVTNNALFLEQCDIVLRVDNEIHEYSICSETFVEPSKKVRVELLECNEVSKFRHGSKVKDEKWDYNLSLTECNIQAAAFQPSALKSYSCLLEYRRIGDTQVKFFPSNCGSAGRSFFFTFGCK